MTTSRSISCKHLQLRMAACLFFLITFLAAVAVPVHAADSTAKIHLLTLPGNSEAVLLEARDESGNPIFGMVDTGEDNDYPNGSDPRYPQRSGIIIGCGDENYVFPYLNAMGVNASNLKFIICTHPHSDHIGLADTLIRQYAPEYVYLMPYSDSYVTNESRLWDNLYVYDQTLAACNETEGVTLIQNPDERPSFQFGAFTIQVVNGSQDYMSTPKPDANQFALGALAIANGHTAFLSSDIDNVDGDENTLVSNYGLYNIDLLISDHHGYPDANRDSYLTSVSPKYYLQDGTFETMNASVTGTLAAVGSHLYSAGGYHGRIPALVIDFSGAESTCNVDNNYMIYSNGTRYAYYNGLPYTGVFTFDGNDYCGDENGVLRTSTSWTNPDDNTQYMFDASGAVINKTSQLTWVQEKNKWYYRDASGKNATGWIVYAGHMYYLQPDGVMATGWLKLDGSWYYFASWGGMMTGWQKINSAWYYLDPNNHGAMVENTWFRTPDGYFSYFQSWGGAYFSTTKKINGISYTFNSARHVTNTAWLDLNGSRYLLSGGKAMTGWAKLKEGYYYLNPDGTLKRNELFSHKNYLYYVNSTGLMAHDAWVSLNGSWYYFQSWGGAYVNCWFRYKNNSYWFDENSVMAVGWRTIAGKTYYFYSWGGMATGKQTIDGKNYEFSSSGALIQS